MIGHCGTKIKLSELIDKLKVLDIDEGIRIELGDDKLFINKNAGGTFVIQFDNSNDFKYLDSARQVFNLVKSVFGTKGKAWSY